MWTGTPLILVLEVFSDVFVLAFVLIVVFIGCKVAMSVIVVWFVRLSIGMKLKGWWLNVRL